MKVNRGLCGYAYTFMFTCCFFTFVGVRVTGSNGGLTLKGFCHIGSGSCWLTMAQALPCLSPTFSYYWTNTNFVGRLLSDTIRMLNSG